MKKYALPILMVTIFEIVAVVLWLTKDNIFYLFNFTYIGCAIALGMVLFVKRYKHARRIVQLLVGLYMLVYLGLICRENMQIEGFWYYLFTGVFEAATIHYAVAKIFGPLIFGRGWCGYACWTAMVLDFLPYKVPKAPRKKIGWIRYITFAGSLIFVSALFLMKVGNLERIMGVSRREYPVLRGRDRACVRIQGQPCVLQIYLPDHRVSEAHELFLALADPVRYGQMRFLRSVQARMSDGRGRDRQFEKESQRHGMHSLHGMCEKLPERRTEIKRLPSCRTGSRTGPDLASVTDTISKSAPAKGLIIVLGIVTVIAAACRCRHTPLFRARHARRFRPLRRTASRRRCPIHGSRALRRRTAALPAPF